MRFCPSLLSSRFALHDRDRAASPLALVLPRCRCCWLRAVRPLSFLPPVVPPSPLPCTPGRARPLSTAPQRFAGCAVGQRGRVECSVEPSAVGRTVPVSRGATRLDWRRRLQLIDSAERRIRPAHTAERRRRGESRQQEFFPDKRKQPLSSIKTTANRVLLSEYACSSMVALVPCSSLRPVSLTFGCGPALFGLPQFATHFGPSHPSGEQEHLARSRLSGRRR